MIDDLLPLFTHAALTAIGAFVGVQSQRMSDDWKTGFKQVFLRGLSVILWPFRWVAKAINDWQRVSAFRHRPLTWDDLPQQAKEKVRFQNLSEDARVEIGVSDLPTSEKRTLLEGYILPRIQGADQPGTVTLFDDSNRTRLSEYALIEVESKGDYVDVLHNGMNLSLKVTFEQPEEGIPFPIGGTISCRTSDWAIVGTIQYRDRTSLGTQSIMVWVSNMSFYRNRIKIFSDTS